MKKINRLQKIKEILRDKKKHIAIIIALIAVVVLAAVFYLRSNKQSAESPKPLGLIDQYRDQLSELEEKAKSGKAADIQNYGIALYATGDFTKAEETYKKQIAIDTQNALAYNNLANSLRDQKKNDEAVAAYEKAIELSPKSLNSYVNLASLYQYSLKDTGKALEVYKRGIEKNPEIIDFHILIGGLYEQNGDYSNAQQSFQAALEIQADNQAAKAGIERTKDK